MFIVGIDGALCRSLADRMHDLTRKGRGEPVVWSGLALYCLFLSWFNWAVMPPDNAFSGDTAHWLSEAYRASFGEVPYRDFSWQFPPLSVYLYGWAFRALRATYGVASLLGAILSTVAVLLMYAVARRFLDRPFAIAAVVVFATAGAFNFQNFALFGLRIYSPAILVGYVGLLAFVLGVDGFLRLRAWSRRDALLVTVGFFICLSAKPEFALSAMLGLACALALSASFIRSLTLGAGFLALPLAFYAWVASQVGLAALLEGIGGYGLIELSCPWWPTGSGLVAVAGAAVVAATLLAASSALDWRFLDPSQRRALTLILAIGLPLSLAALAFFAYLYGDRLGPLAIARQAANFSNAMLAALWLSIAWLLWRIWRTMTGRYGNPLQNPAFQAELVLFAVAIIPSVRSLFTKNAVNPIPIPAMATYPLLCVCALVVADQVLVRWGRARSAIVFVTMLYSASRVAGFIWLSDPWPPVALHTRAGTLFANKADAEVHASLYPYLEERLAERESLVELGYAGGWTFALHARSPFFLTQSVAYAPSAQRLREDRERLEASPPRFAVVPDSPDQRWALWGVAGNFGCTFPRLLWTSNVPSDRPEIRFPAADYVRQRYVPAIRVPGRFVLLELARAM